MGQLAASQNADKTRFAMALIRYPGDPHKAAFSVLGDDPGTAMQAARQWPLDQFVLQEVERLKTEGEGADLWDKDTVAYKLQQMIEGGEAVDENKLKAVELLSKVRGFIERPSVNNGIINQTNKVMIVREFADNEQDWESRAALAQQELASDAVKTLQGN